MNKNKTTLYYVQIVGILWICTYFSHLKASHHDLPVANDGKLVDHILEVPWTPKRVYEEIEKSKSDEQALNVIRRALHAGGKFFKWAKAVEIKSLVDFVPQDAHLPLAFKLAEKGWVKAFAYFLLGIEEHDTDLLVQLLGKAVRDKERIWHTLLAFAGDAIDVPVDKRYEMWATILEIAAKYPSILKHVLVGSYDGSSSKGSTFRSPIEVALKNKYRYGFENFFILYDKYLRDNQDIIPHVLHQIPYSVHYDKKFVPNTLLHKFIVDVHVQTKGCKLESFLNWIVSLPGGELLLKQLLVKKNNCGEKPIGLKSYLDAKINNNSENLFLPILHHIKNYSFQDAYHVLSDINDSGETILHFLCSFSRLPIGVVNDTQVFTALSDCDSAPKLVPALFTTQCRYGYIPTDFIPTGLRDMAGSLAKYQEPRVHLIRDIILSIEDSDVRFAVLSAKSDSQITVATRCLMLPSELLKRDLMPILVAQVVDVDYDGHSGSLKSRLSYYLTGSLKIRLSYYLRYNRWNTPKAIDELLVLAEHTPDLLVTLFTMPDSDGVPFIFNTIFLMHKMLRSKTTKKFKSKLQTECVKNLSKIFNLLQNHTKFSDMISMRLPKDTWVKLKKKSEFAFPYCFYKKKNFLSTPSTITIKDILTAKYDEDEVSSLELLKNHMQNGAQGLEGLHKVVTLLTSPDFKPIDYTGPIPYPGKVYSWPAPHIPPAPVFTQVPDVAHESSVNSPLGGDQIPFDIPYNIPPPVIELPDPSEQDLADPVIGVSRKIGTKHTQSTTQESREEQAGISPVKSLPVILTISAAIYGIYRYYKFKKKKEKLQKAQKNEKTAGSSVQEQQENTNNQMQEEVQIAPVE